MNVSHLRCEADIERSSSQPFYGGGDDCSVNCDVHFERPHARIRGVYWASNGWLLIIIIIIILVIIIIIIINIVLLLSSSSSPSSSNDYNIPLKCAVLAIDADWTVDRWAMEGSKALLIKGLPWIFSPK